MPKIVLLPVSGSPGDPDLLTMALSVTRQFDPHLIGLHVRPDVKREVASLAGSDGGISAGIDTMLERLEADADAAEKTASESWRTFCAQNGITAADTPGEEGVTAEWVSEIGTEADWVAEYGRTADLIVVGRGEEKWGADHVLMEAALMDTGKPVLIAPASASAAPSSGVVGIAWKDTREAAGAVRAALPFLRAAKQVTIFTVSENDDGDESPIRLARMLRWHNPNVSVQVLRQDGNSSASVLLDAAARAQCELLVMGAYGHTRLREAVFGGFTRAVLEAASLPVLMAH